MSNMTDKAMGILTHRDRPEIPSGKAMLVLNDNGWVGTNNGNPFAGQPALFPEPQARAIKDAWWHHYLLGPRARKNLTEYTEMTRAQTRHEALADDWNRLRDVEYEWMLFRRRAFRVTLVVAVVFTLAQLVGCDSMDKRCLRWDAMVKGYDACKAAPSCSLDALSDRHHTTARVERLKWCPADRRP